MRGASDSTPVEGNGNGGTPVGTEEVATVVGESAHEAFRRLTERPADLLRFATAGSVDDGKSTLDRAAAV